MIFVLLLLLMLSCYSIKIAKRGSFHTDYISKNNTTAINGFFVVLVFLCHFAQYVNFSQSFIDQSFVVFKSYLGQLVVTTFFFFSGYGIICSISKKGLPYVKNIPRKRFLSVLIHFDIAVIIYIIINLIFGRKYSLVTNLLALIGWVSIGNSNWYIFAILSLYLIVYLSFIVCKGNKIIGTIITSVLTVVLALIMILAKKPSYYYSTLICYPLGMIFGLFKEKLDKLIMRNDFIYSCFLVSTIIYIALTYIIHGKWIEQFLLRCIFFIAFIIIASMKIQINNKFLQFLGKHIFSIYILQRIPMFLFNKIGLSSYTYIFLAVTFITTIGLAFAYDKCMTIIDKKLLKKA